MEWIPKSGVVLSKNAPQQIELVDKEQISKKVFFTFTSPDVYDDDDLFEFKAINRDTKKPLLVNGRSTFKSGIRSLQGLKSVYLVVTDIKGK